MGMNRKEAIEQAAQLFLQVLEHNDNRLTDSVFDSINGLREAMAMPKVDSVNISPECVDENANRKHDAERVALLERIDNHMEDNSDLFDLLRDIRAYLQGGA